MRLDVVAIWNDSPFVLPVVSAFHAVRWVVGALPWKVNCQVWKVEKKRLIAVLLYKLNTVSRLQIRGVARFHFDLIVMPPVFVAVAVDV